MNDWRLTWKQKKRIAETSWYKGLLMRAATCAESIGITSRQELMDAYLGGKLIPLKTPRNYGWLAHKAVAAWLGLPEPMKRTAEQWQRECERKLKQKEAEVDIGDWD